MEREDHGAGGVGHAVGCLKVRPLRLPSVPAPVKHHVGGV
ncbi:hypothetical protein SLNHY_6076 [Streptomyces albus]|nr:hypothetical protein SLNHY_1542 [Streptomyces albus]AOU77511.1 hypothetical protein SLNHY_2820 [Streptomyces albus]AOU78702.1 hypothetical protein SLNHY_4011 [Streptomyces albus]AOU80767.1 hypothetical protein SLNHY_6076 [Streptomyces albus]